MAETEQAAKTIAEMIVPEQLSFFALDETQTVITKRQGTHPKDDIVWSYSRREALEHCPRKYYYDYYGANSKTAKDEKDKAILQLAKSLKNRFLRSGEILHLVIRTYLKGCQNDKKWSDNGLIDWAKKIFQEDRKYSSSNDYRGEQSKQKFPPTRLLEYYFQHQDAEALCLESEKRLVQAIINFMKSPELASFHNGASQPNAKIEKKFVLQNGIFRAQGQIDLAYSKEDKTVVADWKTGEAGGAEESLQLTFYGLWAVNEFNCVPEKIQLFRVNLAESKVQQFFLTNKNLSRAKAKIMQDLERMRMLHSYGVNANAKAFTPCGQTKICALCPFQGICPKE
ncbi:PD-(D/E)XK nuclease family protein [candidate division KSB1 bacterium]|nr:PD-(D/E)XK nuclease family protein [candidate division KSB1 bacterium]